jgi:hypothetical protein
LAAEQRIYSQLSPVRRPIRARVTVLQKMMLASTAL